MRHFFSIIVPAYNVGDYIENTINSIINQDLTDYELILVDDGSSDKTAVICKKYLESLPDNIVFIQREHKGVSAARNEGLKRATGEYIMFVDGDDYLVSGSLSYLHKILSFGYPDLLCFNFSSTCSMRDSISAIDDATENISISYVDAIAWKLGEKTIPCYAACIRNDIIRNYRLSFDEDLTYVEDALFLFKCMLVSKSIWLNRNILYMYLQRQGSATHLDYVLSSVVGMELRAWKRIKQLVCHNPKLKQLVRKRVNPIRKVYYMIKLKELIKLR